MTILIVVKAVFFRSYFPNQAEPYDLLLLNVILMTDARTYKLDSILFQSWVSLLLERLFG